MNETIQKALQSQNIAEWLDDDQLVTIGNDVYEGYKADKASRAHLEEKLDMYMMLAMQVVEEKNSPWPNAANVKYPLLTTATMQFAARAYPALVTSPSIVKGRVSGYDPTGVKAISAERVGKHMSYQLIEEMDGWEEGMDRLCLSLPMNGSMFKKTYFSPSKGTNCSELVYPKNLVVNYWAKSLVDAPRITHVLSLSDNDIHERIKSGVFLDQEYYPDDVKVDPQTEKLHGVTSPNDSTTPGEFLEQHTWIDLDDDGYKEPYIVTTCGATVARIVACYDEEDVILNQKEEVIRINRTEYFTHYVFVPNPDGSFYGIGFGTLLYPINEVINTTTNQLLDAGTLSNRQGGFLGRGLKLKGGEYSFKPGEWKQTVSSGDDLRKNIFPLPVREPSGTLFNLLNMMIDAGKELSNTVPMLLGQNPGQNQPATTSMAVIEQGLKVFSGIFKRMHRSLKLELQKLKRLNKLYLPPASYFQVLDFKEGQEAAEQIFAIDYSDDVTDVQPYSDPNIISETQRMIKAQQVMEMLQQGLIPNAAAGTQFVLEAMDIPQLEVMMQAPEQGPPPEIQIKQMEIESKMEVEGEKLQLERERFEFEKLVAADKQELNETVRLLNLAKADAMDAKTQIDFYRAQIEELKADIMARQKEEKDDEREKKADERMEKQKPPVVTVEAPITVQMPSPNKKIAFDRDENDRITGAEISGE